MFRVRSLLAGAAVLIGLGPAAQAQVKLEYKFHEGSKTTAQTTTKVHQILTIKEMDVETTAENVTTVSSAAGTRKPDGTLPIETTIESLRLDLSLPGNIMISFDSANPPAKKEEIPQLAAVIDLLRALAGSSYTITLDKQDQVLAVEGVQKVIDRINAANPGAADLVKDQVDPETIKREFQQHHGNLPDILVREGDTWDRTEVDDIGSGQTLTFKKRYEYLGTVQKGGKTLDKIGVKATDVTYAMSPNSPSPVKVGKSDLKVDSSEGQLLFDRKAGRVVESRSKDRIKGELTLTVNGQDLPSKLDLTMDSQRTLQP